MPEFKHEPCPEHGPTCTQVSCLEDDGTVSSRSHAPAGIRPGTRVNIDHPVIAGSRWELYTPQEAELLGLPPELHRRVAYDAMQRDLFTQQELAVIADVLGVTASDLTVEANEKGWDAEPPRRSRP